MVRRFQDSTQRSGETAKANRSNRKAKEVS
jgi:hypothetical protein